MKKKIIVLFIAAFPLFGYNLHACDCVGKDSIQEALKKADYVFIGKAISVKRDSLVYENVGITVYKNEFTFEIVKLYKGKVKFSTLVIISGVSHGDCGFIFNLEDIYIIYASWEKELLPNNKRSKKFLYTEICSRTLLYMEKEQIEIEKYVRPKKR